MAYGVKILIDLKTSIRFLLVCKTSLIEGLNLMLGDYSRFKALPLNLILTIISISSLKLQIGLVVT